MSKRGRQSTGQKRCPRCKQLRRQWLPESWESDERKLNWSQREEGKICHVCVYREKDPTWRPGKPKPKGDHDD